MIVVGVYMDHCPGQYSQKKIMKIFKTVCFVLFFFVFILKTLLLRMSQKVYKKYHAQKVLKFALDIELAQLKFTYITVLK